MRRPGGKVVWKPPLRVFFSYSHADGKLRDRLDIYLRAMVRQGLIMTWHDRDIPAGKKWKPEIARELEETDIFLALVTADFIASEYCYDIEFERARERAERDECRIIPVNLRDCDWHPFLKEFQALPSLDRPVMSFPDPETGFSTVARMLREEIERMILGETSRAVSVSRPSGRPPLDAGLPYLCNRTDQETGVIQALGGAACRDRRPFVLITCGHPGECHEAFLARIRRSPLPRLLGLEDKPDATGPVPLNWPASYREGASPHEIFAVRVATCLSSLESDSRKLVRTLPPGMTAITTNIWADRWSARDEWLLESYLDYWNSWPPVPPQRGMVVAIPIKYQTGGFGVEALRQRLDFARWPNLRGVILDEFQEIPLGDAQNWAGHPEVRRYYPANRHQELCNEILALYQTERMRMGALAPGLLVALGKFACSR